MTPQIRALRPAAVPRVLPRQRSFTSRLIAIPARHQIANLTPPVGSLARAPAVSPRDASVTSFFAAGATGLQRRGLHTSAARPKTVTAGPNNEPVPDRQPPTDFGAMDVLGQTPVPSTSVEMTMADGFQLNSGVVIDGGAAALLVGGEAFAWKPWGEGMRLLNGRGQWDVSQPEAWGVLGLVWPRPGESAFFFFSCSFPFWSGVR